MQIACNVHTYIYTRAVLFDVVNYPLVTFKTLRTQISIRLVRLWERERDKLRACFTLRGACALFLYFDILLKWTCHEISAVSKVVYMYIRASCTFFLRPGDNLNNDCRDEKWVFLDRSRSLVMSSWLDYEWSQLNLVFIFFWIWYKWFLWHLFIYFGL